MANTPSAEKRIRQAAKRQLQNRAVKSTMKTGIKKFRTALPNAESPEQAQALYAAAVRDIDKAASKGVIHKNQANRRKSRLAKKLLSVQA